MSDPKVLSVAEHWTAFRLTVIPYNAPDLQVTEMRNAFYAGFETCYQTMFDLGGKEFSEAYAERVLQTLRDELSAYALSVMANAQKKRQG